MIKNISNIFKPWFVVDSRALGLYRIVFGILCLSDIIRRWEFIDIFYTNHSIIQSSISLSAYKNFTLLNTFTLSWEVHIFFLVGIIFSIMLILGYKTKLSQIIVAIIIISIHNRATILENAGDFYMNCMLVWSAFLPLGLTFSIDSLRKTLSEFKESSVDDLNNQNNGINKPSSIYSLAYFCMLYQLSIIYFFTGINKTGYDWSNGTAVYKMFQLDTFLTPIGYFLRDYITLPVTKFFTYTTLGIEHAAPIILFFPFYYHIVRIIFIFIFSIFHISIRATIKVGLFSYILMSTFILLIDKRVFDKIKIWIINKYNKNYILFYDSDCGFCHYSVRIIKRTDIFNRITFADASYKEPKPDNFDNLSNLTAILLEVNSGKIWTKHEVFGKILFLIPCGFLLGWIFFIPGISLIFEYIYDVVARNRTKISSFFGLPACGLKQFTNNDNNNIYKNIISKYSSSIFYCRKIISYVLLLMILRASINYSLSANDGVNNYMEDHGFGKKYFTHKPILKKIVNYPRMIQRWNMFSPTVLGSDKVVVIEATLSNGDIINPFTGKAPILDSVEYPDLWHNDNQFWRKFFSRITKKSKQKSVDRFVSWLKRYNNDYFEDILNGNRIRSVNIWSLSQRNTNINSDKINKVFKKLLNSSSKKSNASNSKPLKVKPKSK